MLIWRWFFAEICCRHGGNSVGRFLQDRRTACCQHARSNVADTRLRGQPEFRRCAGRCSASRRGSEAERAGLTSAIRIWRSMDSGGDRDFERHVRRTSSGRYDPSAGTQRARVEREVAVEDRAAERKLSWTLKDVDNVTTRAEGSPGRLAERGIPAAGDCASLIRTVVMLTFWVWRLPVAALLCFPWTFLTGDISFLYRIAMWGPGQAYGWRA